LSGLDITHTICRPSKVRSSKNTRRCLCRKTFLSSPLDEPVSSSWTVSSCFIISSRALIVCPYHANIAVQSNLEVDRRQQDRSTVVAQATGAPLLLALLQMCHWTNGQRFGSLYILPLCSAFTPQNLSLVRLLVRMALSTDLSCRCHALRLRLLSST
jgi:hypothetical protein